MSNLEDYRIVRAKFCGLAKECKSESCDLCMNYEKHLTHSKCELNYLCRISHCVQKHEECYIRFVRDTQPTEIWNEFKAKIKSKNKAQMEYILKGGTK